MTRGIRAKNMRISRTMSSKVGGSDDSDEDYIVSNEENEVSSDSNRSSPDGYASEEEFNSVVEEERMISVVKPKAKGISSRFRKCKSKTLAPRRRNTHQEEDADYDENEDMSDNGNEDEDEEFKRVKEDWLKLETFRITKPRTQRGSKRRRSNVSYKSLRKRGRRNSGSRSKTSCQTNSIVNNRKKNYNNPSKRLKRDAATSDSEFSYSGSSDYEYTISEEEREQVREAAELCASMENGLRNPSLSHGISNTKEVHQKRKNLKTKGKEKIEEEKVELVKNVCGICLCEEGKRKVRGTLNCCDHYFCISCIVEWAKVESRCPLCKQRFETITRASRSTAGFNLREAVILVPERNQVHQPSEEDFRSYLERYNNVTCSKCHEVRNDALLLLCDICGSAAHTYCIGLGSEVPQGNWYCEDCRLLVIGMGSSSASEVYSYGQRTPLNNLSDAPLLDLNIGEELYLNSISSSVGSSQTTSLLRPGVRTGFGRRQMYRPRRRFFASS